MSRQLDLSRRGPDQVDPVRRRTNEDLHGMPGIRVPRDVFEAHQVVRGISRSTSTVIPSSAAVMCETPCTWGPVTARMSAQKDPAISDARMRGLKLNRTARSGGSQDERPGPSAGTLEGQTHLGQQMLDRGEKVCDGVALQRGTQ